MGAVRRPRKPQLHRDAMRKGAGAIARPERGGPAPRLLQKQSAEAFRARTSGALLAGDEGLVDDHDETGAPELVLGRRGKRGQEPAAEDAVGPLHRAAVQARVVRHMLHGQQLAEPAPELSARV